MNRSRLLPTLALAALAGPVSADEGGASFWLPGQYGSLAATPGAPGWSLPVVSYHPNASGGGERGIPIGGRLALGLDAQADLVFIAPTYVLKTPVAGAQMAVGLTAVVGRLDVDVEATLTGPGGGQIGGRASDSDHGIGDLYPSMSLKWAHGVHHTMAYAMAGVPVGSYDVDRLANLGTNHWSFDAGGGYTYFNPAKGREFSAVLGFTLNGENPDTDYKNGVDAHLDWAASQFLSPRLQVGVVGYFYHQLTGDSGDGATLGDFKARVNGIGPQIGYLFPAGGKTWYFNLKGYHEFDGKNRPAGWNVWAALVIPLSAPPPAPPPSA